MIRIKSRKFCVTFFQKKIANVVFSHLYSKELFFSIFNYTRKISKIQGFFDLNRYVEVNILQICRGMYQDTPLNRILIAIYNEHYPKLCSVAYRYVHNWEDAQDAVLNAFTCVLLRSQKYSRYDYEEMVKIIYTIVSRCAIKIFQKNQRKEQLTLQFSICDSVHTDRELAKMLDDKECIKSIFRLLRKKGPLYADVFILRFIYHLPFEKIAKKLNISDEAARQRCSRILKIIKKKITI